VRGLSPFAQRFLVAVVLLPVGAAMIWLGGWYFLAIAIFFVGPAAWEFVQLLRAGGYQPAGLLVVGGSVALLIERSINSTQSGPWLLSLLVLAAMLWHMLTYERGRDMAATDFAITITGIVYIGWIGAYFISLGQLPYGNMWVILVLASIWVADTTAYSVGRRWGRHKLSKRLSPQKSWEGYLAGIVAATLAIMGLAWAFGSIWSLEAIFQPQRGAMVGFLMSTVSILGDLGESMIKRQIGVKDSGHALPGHGGFFDRIDSWLWAAVAGYYLVAIFFV